MKPMKSYIKIVSIIALLSIMLLSLSACKIKIWKQFEDWVKTTDDGFTYYYNEGNDKGVYILDIPDTEELIIPEYIEGKRVVELGHRDMGIGYMNHYCIVGTNTKKLTIQHQFDIRYEAAPVRYYVDFPNLTKLTFIDFLYCNQSYSENELLVPHYIGKESSKIPVVELKKSDREYSLKDFKATVIIIPEYVEIIEAGVFDGLTDVTIKTSYEAKPEGWADGWNGSCEVEWGVEIDGITRGNYWSDEKVMVVSTEADIDAEQLKVHYDNGGIIVVRDWQLANDVETIVRGTNASEHDEKDLATVFCKSKSGAPYTGVVQGNTSDLESEIDEMVANAKATQ